MMSTSRHTSALVCAISFLVVTGVGPRARAADAEATHHQAGGQTGYSETIADAWQRLRARAYDQAAVLYARAAELVPDSEDALLGLQLAHLSAGRWSEAATAGDRLLMLAPDSFWAHSRQAYVRYMQGQMKDARAHYLRALELDPEDTEMRLGLGLTLVALGRDAEGHAACRAAAAKLSADDARVRSCLEPRTRRVVITGTVAAAFYTYTNAFDLRDVKALTLTLSARFSMGLTLWLGATLSETVLNYQRDDYRQAAPTLGVSLKRGGWSGQLGGTVLVSSDSAVDGAAVVSGSFGYLAERFGGFLDAAVSVYPAGTAAQLEPRFVWKPSEDVTLSAGPDIRFTAAGLLSSAESDVQVAGAASLSWQASPAWRLSLAGLAGPRRFAVEYGGLGVWSNNDRYLGGYRVGLAWSPLEALTVQASWRHDFGNEQSSVANDFQLLGGTLGVLLVF